MDGYLTSEQLAARLGVGITRAKQIIRETHRSEAGSGTPSTQKVGPAWIIAVWRVEQIERERQTYSGAGRPPHGAKGE